MSRFALRVFTASKLFTTRSGISNSNYLSYKSALSLENLYPGSRLTIYTPTKPPDTSEKGKFDGFIPIDKLNITYSRSSGPGGQNVNTVSTKVDLRIHVESADWLHPEVKAKMLEDHKTKISKEGFLIIRSDKTRSQQLNLADAMAKLREMLWNAAQPTNKEPTPETIERLRRRREKQARERLMEKRMRSLTKEGRQAPSVDM